MDSVETKLTEQRKISCCGWDGVLGTPVNKNANPDLEEGTRKQLQIGNSFVPNSVTVQRWRTRLKDEQRFESGGFYPSPDS